MKKKKKKSLRIFVRDFFSYIFFSSSWAKDSKIGYNIVILNMANGPCEQTLEENKSSSSFLNANFCKISYTINQIQEPSMGLKNPLQSLQKKYSKPNHTHHKYLWNEKEEQKGLFSPSLVCWICWTILHRTLLFGREGSFVNLWFFYMLFLETLWVVSHFCLRSSSVPVAAAMVHLICKPTEYELQHCRFTAAAETALVTKNKFTEDECFHFFCATCVMSKEG